MSKALQDMSLEELIAKKKTLLQQNAMIGVAGSVGGLIYANRTGGGFLRYAGYFFLGAFVVGVIPRLIYFIPESNKIDAQINLKQNTK